MSKKFKIILEVDEKDACSLWAYQEYINMHIKKGTKIPARVLKKYFSFLNDYEGRLKSEYEIRSKRIKSEIINRFKGDIDYWFQDKEEIIKKIVKEEEPKELKALRKEYAPKVLDRKYTTPKEEFSFERMIEFVSDNIRSRQAEIKENNKGYFCKLVFNSIEGYFKKFENKDNFYTPYKKQVITGCFAFKFGYNLGKEINELEGKEPPKQLLSKAVAYYTNK